MPDKITFYAVIGGDRTIDNPYGLVRRLESGGDGFTDEGLRKDFSWAFSPAIVEWEHGDLDDELVEPVQQILENQLVRGTRHGVNLNAAINKFNQTIGVQRKVLRLGPVSLRWKQHRDLPGELAALRSRN